MSPTDLPFVYIGFWRRVAATLIDAAIGAALIPVALPLLRLSFEKRSALPQIPFTVVFTLVFLAMVVRLGGTPGKLAVRARIVDQHGTFLPWSRALRRIIPSLVSSAAYFMQLHTAVNAAPAFTSPPSFMDLSAAVSAHGGIFTLLAPICSWFVIVDVGAILFNRKKRAIHDFIAGSYVVTKQSYLVVRGSA